MQSAANQRHTPSQQHQQQQQQHRHRTVDDWANRVANSVLSETSTALTDESLIGAQQSQSVGRAAFRQVFSVSGGAASAASPYRSSTPPPVPQTQRSAAQSLSLNHRSANTSEDEPLPPAPQSLAHHHHLHNVRSASNRSTSQSPSNNTSAFLYHSAAATFADMAALEAAMRQKYDHKVRVMTQSVLHSLSEELPCDHILLQLMSDLNTTEFAKLRVGEVVEAALHSSLGTQHNALIGELSRKEGEVAFLRARLEEATAAMTEAQLQLDAANLDREVPREEAHQERPDPEPMIAAITAELRNAHERDTDQLRQELERANAAAVAAAVAQATGSLSEQLKKMQLREAEDAVQFENLRSDLVAARERANAFEREVASLRAQVVAKDAAIAQVSGEVAALQREAAQQHAQLAADVSEWKASASATTTELQTAATQLADLRAFVQHAMSSFILSHEQKAKERAVASAAARIVRAFEAHAGKPHNLFDEVGMLAFGAVASTLALFAERAAAADALVASLPAADAHAAAGASGSPADRRVQTHANAKDAAHFELLAQQLADQRPALAEAAGEVKQGLRLLKALNKEHEAVQEQLRESLQLLGDAKTAAAERTMQLTHERDQALSEAAQERRRYEQLHAAHELVLSGVKREGEAALVDGVAATAAARVAEVVQRVDAALGSQIAALQQRLEALSGTQSDSARALLDALVQLQVLITKLDASNDARASEIVSRIDTVAQRNAESTGLLSQQLVARAQETSQADAHAAAVALAEANASRDAAVQSLTSLQRLTGNAVSVLRSTFVGMSPDHAVTKGALNNSQQFTTVDDLTDLAADVSVALRDLGAQNAALRHRLRMLCSESLPRHRRALAALRRGLADTATATVRMIDAANDTAARSIVQLSEHLEGERRAVVEQFAQLVVELVENVDDAASAIRNEGSSSRDENSETVAAAAAARRDASIAALRRARDDLLLPSAGFASTSSSIRALAEHSRRLVSVGIATVTQSAAESLRRTNALLEKHQHDHERVVAELRAAKSSADVAAAAAASQMEKARAMMDSCNAQNKNADSAAAQAMSALFDAKAEAEHEMIRLRGENAELRARLDAVDRTSRDEVEKLQDKIAALTKQLVAQEKRNGVLHERCSVKEKENVRLATLVKQHQHQQQHSSVNTNFGTPATSSLMQLLNAGSSGVTPNSTTTPLGNHLNNSQLPPTSSATVMASERSGLAKSPSPAGAAVSGADDRSRSRGRSALLDLASLSGDDPISDASPHRRFGTAATSGNSTSTSAAATALGNFFLASGSRGRAQSAEEGDTSAAAAPAVHVQPPPAARPPYQRRSPTHSVGSVSPRTTPGQSRGTLGAALHFDVGPADEYAGNPSIAIIGA